MGIRNRLIAATMTGLMLTAAVGATAASASPATATPSDGKKKPDADDATLAKVAAGLGVGVKQLSGTDKPDKPGGVPEEAVTLLAAQLHISTDRARQVFKDLEKVKARGDAIVKDPAFVAIAKGLGITPQRLLDVLRKVKQEIGKPGDKPGEKPKDKAPSGSPAR